jgi:hypothetical protein
VSRQELCQFEVSLLMSIVQVMMRIRLVQSTVVLLVLFMALRASLPSGSKVSSSEKSWKKLRMVL